MTSIQGWFSYQNKEKYVCKEDVSLLPQIDQCQLSTSSQYLQLGGHLPLPLLLLPARWSPPPPPQLRCPPSLIPGLIPQILIKIYSFPHTSTSRIPYSVLVLSSPGCLTTDCLTTDQVGWQYLGNEKSYISEIYWCQNHRIFENISDFLVHIYFLTNLWI